MYLLICRFPLGNTEKQESMTRGDRDRRCTTDLTGSGRCAGLQVSPAVLEDELLAKVGTPLYFCATF